MGMAVRSAFACLDCSCQLHRLGNVLLHCKDTTWRCECACKRTNGSEEETFLSCGMSIFADSLFKHWSLMSISGLLYGSVCKIDQEMLCC